MFYRYYPGNSSSRPLWIKYVDDLIDSGRKYVTKPFNEESYTQLKSKEIMKLASLMLLELPSPDRYDILLESDSDYEFPGKLCDYMINPSDQNEPLFFMINKIINYFKPLIEEVMEQAVNFNKPSKEDYYDEDERYCEAS